MLTRIVVGNFKSFDEVTDLNMVSSSKIRTKADHRVVVAPNLKLLRHAVIYGANASGKSNLIALIIAETGKKTEIKKAFLKSRWSLRANSLRMDSKHFLRKEG